MNEEKDPFSNLEEDISGDWKDIQKKTQQDLRNKHKKHLINNPSRPDMSSFDDFYESLVEMAYSGGNKDVTWESNLYRNILRFVKRGTHTFPESIKHVWESLCNPMLASKGEICRRCHCKLDIVYTREEPQRISYPILDDPYENMQKMESKYVTVFCPSCGEPLLRISGEVVSISLIKEYNKKNRRERRYDIR